MLAFLKREYPITASMCDSSAKLGVYNTFQIFQDIASDHAAILGCGNFDLEKKDIYWVAVKTKVKFYRMPKLSEVATFETWPEEPDRIRYNRIYRAVDRNGETLLEGKTEWTLVNAKTGRLYIGECVYPKNADFFKEYKVDIEFDKVSTDFTESDLLTTHEVRSMDIDLAHHMNNCQYVRVLLNSFTVNDLENAPIKEMDFQYKVAAHEGDTLEYRIKTVNEKNEVAILADKRIIALATFKR